MYTFFVTVCLIISMWFFVSLFASRNVSNIGSRAFDFTLMDENGKTVSLPKTGKVVLVFFPKAHRFSFGCKKEVCSIRDGFSDLKEQGITIYGLTGSSVEDIKAFVENNRLPFSLLHATDEIMQAYGVANGWFGAQRCTILIQDGIIVSVIHKVDLENHPQQIIEGFKSVAKNSFNQN